MRSHDAVERRQGWEAWYERDAPALIGYIERRCRAHKCPDHSEDISQDTFLIGFRNVSSGRYQEQGVPLRAYLYGIAFNLIHEVARLRYRESTMPNELEVEALSSLCPDDIISAKEIVRRVQDACADLPQVHLLVLKRVYLEQRTASQVAEEVGKTAGNIRAIAHRAVHHVEQHLKHYHGLNLSHSAIRACLEVLSAADEA
jgi:RNA polymerase sigma factor (sigma-70 family)